jgi:beta-glucosidase
MFRTGLFDNPFLDPKNSTEIVGCEAYRTAGYAAQLKSVVMLKNRNRTIPLKRNIKVYIPDRYIKSHKSFMRTIVSAQSVHPVRDEIVAEYFEPVVDPEIADAAIVFMESPFSDPYSADDREKGGNGYFPISLQYRPYTAAYARKKSIAGGDPRDVSPNRSYFGKMSEAANEKDLDILIETRRRMGNKPVIVCLAMHNPTVPSEFEPFTDTILIDFGVERSALFDIITGKSEPCGRLPANMPKNMKTVELHNEDTAEDIEPYEDSCGNIYRFGFGLGWKGPVEPV